MKKAIKYSILIFCISGQLADAQELLSGKTETPKELILKVSQYGQFVKRFNYHEDFWGNPITPAFSKKVSRPEYLGALFNNQDKRLLKTTSEYSQLKAMFIKNVVDKNLIIDRASDSLFSVAVCNVTYRNAPATIKLVLKQQKINHGLAWVINDVSSNFLYVGENNPSDSFRFIPPTSNEVNYIHLKNLLSANDSLASLAYPEYSCNRLSIFFHLLHSGDIRFKNVNSVIYFIYDIPGWVVQVKEFTRNGDNSGWLINNVSLNILPSDQFIRMAVDNIPF